MRFGKLNSLVRKVCFFGALALAAAQAGCGQELQGESASHLNSPGPDLRFASSTVAVYVPGLNTPVQIANGATFHVPCNTPGFRARYRYGNFSPVSAGPHTNSSATVGSATYPFAQSSLTAATLRDAFASFGAITVPNTPVKIAIYLDSAGAVAESDEGNNEWVAKVVRYCP